MNATLHPCQTCALRKNPVFTPFTEQELDFMKQFRDGDLHLCGGETLFHEGDRVDFFYTAKSGQGARVIHLPNGERQLVNFIFPGDTIGLQAALAKEASSSVIAASDMVLCKFHKTSLPDLFRQSARRAYSLVWIAAVEEHFLGETIATLGQRDALQRMAWALCRISTRLAAVGLSSEGRSPFPFKQRDLADALGLSLVHTNKTLARLRPFVRWEKGTLTILDAHGLSEIAMLDHVTQLERPLL